MSPRNNSKSPTDLPRHLRKDPAKQRQKLASRFNFSWIGGMAQRLRSALSRENKLEAQNVRRQSEDARKFRAVELEARKSESMADSEAEASSRDRLPRSHIETNGGRREIQKPQVVLNADPQSTSQPERLYAATETDAESGSNHTAVDTANGAILAQEERPSEGRQLSDVAYDDLDLQASVHTSTGEEDLRDSSDVEYAGLDAKGLDVDRPDAGNLSAGCLDAEDSDAEGLVSEAEHIGAEDLDADDLDADDLDAEDLDAEDLDAEDLDADDLDAEDFDVEDVDAEDVDAGVVDADDGEPADFDHNAEHAGVSDVDAHHRRADAQSLDEDAYAPVEPSDHEAHEYDAELSSMSVWEGAGFDSYDPVMDVDYERQGSEGDKENFAGLGSELDSEPEQERDSSEPPLVRAPNPAVFTSQDSRLLGTEPSISSVSTGAKSEPSLTPLPDSRLQARDGSCASSVEKIEVQSPSSKQQQQQQHSPVVGSLLHPSQRYLGFHFGPARNPTTTSLKGGIEARASAATVGPAVEESTTSTVAANYDEKEENGAPGAEDVRESIEEREIEDVRKLPRSSDENPYAGLWNLFNVGFTVAPSASALKERKAEELTSRPVEPEVSLADEFHLLAQAAHRVMAGSTLFGGAPALPKSRSSTESLVSLAPSKDQDPASYNRRVSSIAHGLFAQSSLFGGKSTSASLSEQKSNTEPSEGDLQVNQFENQATGATAPTARALDRNATKDVEVETSGRETPNSAAPKVEKSVAHFVAQDPLEIAVAPGAEQDPAKTRRQHGSDEPSDSIQENHGSIDPVKWTHAEASTQDAHNILSNAVAEEPKDTVHSRKLGSVGLTVADAKQNEEDGSAKADNARVEDRPRGNLEKRRRLRSTTPRAEPVTTSESEAKVDVDSESEERILDTSDHPNSKKRKRVERTRPLTRAALRAQKEREALEKVEESDTDLKSLSKKRKNGSSQKDGSARRTKKNA